MGKTKTAVISGMPEDEKLTGKAAYEAKKKAQDAKKAAEAKVTKKGKGAVGGVGLKGGERIKVVGGEVPLDEPADDSSSMAAKKKAFEPKVRGKKYKASLAKVDRNKLYPLKDAVKLVKETSFSKFDGTVELHLTVKKEGLSAKVTLPHL